MFVFFTKKPNACNKIDGEWFIYAYVKVLGYETILEMFVAGIVRKVSQIGGISFGKFYTLDFLASRIKTSGKKYAEKEQIC